MMTRRAWVGRMTHTLRFLQASQARPDADLRISNLPAVRGIPVNNGGFEGIDSQG